jgi:hypothetical protein
LGREKDVRANDPVDLLFVNASRRARRVTKVHSNHWLVDQSQSSNPQLARDGYAIERSVNLNARRQLRFDCGWLQPKILATIQSDCAYWRAAIDRKPRWLAIDKGAYQQMVLLRAHQRQRFKLRGCPRVSAARRGSQFENHHQRSRQNREKLPHEGEMI